MNAKKVLIVLGLVLILFVICFCSLGSYFLNQNPEYTRIGNIELNQVNLVFSTRANQSTLKETLDLNFGDKSKIYSLIKVNVINKSDNKELFNFEFRDTSDYAKYGHMKFQIRTSQDQKFIYFLSIDHADSNFLFYDFEVNIQDKTVKNEPVQGVSGFENTGYYLSFNGYRQTLKNKDYFIIR